MARDRKQTHKSVYNERYKHFLVFLVVQSVSFKTLIKHFIVFIMRNINTNFVFFNYILPKNIL